MFRRVDKGEGLGNCMVGMITHSSAIPLGEAMMGPILVVMALIISIWGASGIRTVSGILIEVLVAEVLTYILKEVFLGGSFDLHHIILSPSFLLLLRCHCELLATLSVTLVRSFFDVS